MGVNPQLRFLQYKYCHTYYGSGSCPKQLTCVKASILHMFGPCHTLVSSKNTVLARLVLVGLCPQQRSLQTSTRPTWPWLIFQPQSPISATQNTHVHILLVFWCGVYSLKWNKCVRHSLIQICTLVFVPAGP